MIETVSPVGAVTTPVPCVPLVITSSTIAFVMLRVRVFVLAVPFIVSSRLSAMFEIVIVLPETTISFEAFSGYV